MINEAEERRQFNDWLREELPPTLREAALYGTVREAWWVVWKGCAQKKAERLAEAETADRIKAEQAEEHWLVAHDDRCDNTHRCASFGGTGRCYYTRDGGMSE